MKVRSVTFPAERFVFGSRFLASIREKMRQMDIDLQRLSMRVAALLPLSLRLVDGLPTVFSPSLSHDFLPL